MNAQLQDNKLPKSNRLLSPSEFETVFSKVELRVGCRNFTMLATLNQQPESKAKLGLIVGKKNIKKAVYRNYFKRSVKEFFRSYCKHLRGVELIYIAKKSNLKEDAVKLDLQDELRYSLKRLNKWYKQIESDQ